MELGEADIGLACTFVPPLEPDIVVILQPNPNNSIFQESKNSKPQNNTNKARTLEARVAKDPTFDL